MTDTRRRLPHAAALALLVTVAGCADTPLGSDGTPATAAVPPPAA